MRYMNTLWRKRGPTGILWTTLVLRRDNGKCILQETFLLPRCSCEGTEERRGGSLLLLHLVSMNHESFEMWIWVTRWVLMVVIVREVRCTSCLWQRCDVEGLLQREIYYLQLLATESPCHWSSCVTWASSMQTRTYLVMWRWIRSHQAMDML